MGGVGGVGGVSGVGGVVVWVMLMRRVTVVGLLNRLLSHKQEGKPQNIRTIGCIINNIHTHILCVCVCVCVCVTDV